MSEKPGRMLLVSLYHVMSLTDKLHSQRSLKRTVEKSQFPFLAYETLNKTAIFVGPLPTPPFFSSFFNKIGFRSKVPQFRECELF